MGVKISFKVVNLKRELTFQSPQGLLAHKLRVSVCAFYISTGIQGSAILLRKQVSKASIAKIVGVTGPTIHRFIKTRRLRPHP